MGDAIYQETATLIRMNYYQCEKTNEFITLSLARKVFAEYMNNDWQMPAYTLIKTEVKTGQAKIS